MIKIGYPNAENSDVDYTGQIGAERHFSCTYVRMVLGHVHRKLGKDGVQTMLRMAGETRSVAELTDEVTWSSYTQFRNLLEAVGSLLGGTSKVEQAGTSFAGDLKLGQLADLIQALGSPEAMYRNYANSGSATSTILSMTATEVGPQEWIVRQQLADGFEPFDELCAFMRGAHTIGPELFGFPAASVVEEECQRMGAPECVLRIRWKVIDEAARQSGFHDARVTALQARLDEFQRTAADLVSSSDIDTVLHRALESASRTVHAPVFVLALGDDALLSRRVYAVGLEPVEAERLAAELLNRTEPTNWLAVEVASTQRTYGRLAAIRNIGGFLPQERPTLQAYGRFAATALDSAFALEEARRQGATARALLELSTALAEISSIDEMAAKLVRAVPTVIGCDQAAVLLPDRQPGHARVAVTQGFSKQDDALLRSRTVPISDTPSGQIEVRDPLGSPTPPDTAILMKATGTSYALRIPIIVDGEWAGAIVAAVTHDSRRLQQSLDAQERLRGLAAQASTAIQNARLLDQVRHQAFHDPLTGLPNRALILDRVEQMLVRARRQSRPAAALFVDLDGFKDINDTLGHETGDDLLRAVTARLQTTLRESDTIGRLGGDEFVILLDGASFDVGPELVAERVLTVLRKPFVIDEQHAGPLAVTASIGIATGDRSNAGELLRDADVALYAAKAAGKDRYVVFEPEMQTAVHDRLLLQMDLQTALAHGEFFLVYQPIFALSSGEVTGVEALLRWRHPTRGEIQPDAFIPILEENDLIVDVGRWALREACRQTRSWHDDGLLLDIAVNVSARQLQSDVFVQHIRDALDESHLSPAWLVVEITETAIMTNMQDTARRLADIKEVGVRIAIDDFGTGYSSLAYLQKFPVDTLKIDRTFVAALGESAESVALVHTLVQLAKSLGLDTVAEGIEDLVQYERLHSEHCDSGQGFLVARPMTDSALREFLTLRTAATP